MHRREPRRRVAIADLAVVIVTGPPCSGKSTLGRRLAADLELPFISKDGFKETLFESLGYPDLDWSRRLGHASYALLFHTADVLLSAHESFVLEANFYWRFHAAPLRALQAKHAFTAVQIVCSADPETLRARNRHRAETGERHPGHLDQLSVDDFDRHLRPGVYGALDLEGEVVCTDTTRFGTAEYGALLASLRLVHPHEVVER